MLRECLGLMRPKKQEEGEEYKRRILTISTLFIYRMAVVYVFDVSKLSV